MLYLGHFYFNETAQETALQQRGPAHGYFTCIAEAGDAEAAIDKFKTLLRTLHREGDLFEHVREVYLDACVEIRSIPKQGFLAYFTSRQGEDLGGISTAIRGASEREAVGFDVGTEDAASGQPRPVEPFVVFNE
jgi:hypothetical protein